MSIFLGYPGQGVEEEMQSHDDVVKYAQVSLFVDAFPLNVSVTVVAEGHFSE